MSEICNEVTWEQWVLYYISTNGTSTKNQLYFIFNVVGPAAAINNKKRYTRLFQISCIAWWVEKWEMPWETIIREAIEEWYGYVLKSISKYDKNDINDVRKLFWSWKIFKFITKIFPRFSKVLNISEYIRNNTTLLNNQLHINDASCKFKSHIIRLYTIQENAESAIQVSKMWVAEHDEYWNNIKWSTWEALWYFKISCEELIKCLESWTYPRQAELEKLYLELLHIIKNFFLLHLYESSVEQIMQETNIIYFNNTQNCNENWIEDAIIENSIRDKLIELLNDETIWSYRKKMVWVENVDENSNLLNNFVSDSIKLIRNLKHKNRKKKLPISWKLYLF